MINLGISRKNYKHDRSNHVNTTADLGHFQPTFLEYLSPNDKVVIKDYAQLIRNSIMPSPTFGRLTCVNDFSFVKLVDIHKAFPALISGTKVHVTGANYFPVKVLESSFLNLFMCIATANSSGGAVITGISDFLKIGFSKKVGNDWVNGSSVQKTPNTNALTNAEVNALFKSVDPSFDSIEKTQSFRTDAHETIFDDYSNLKSFDFILEHNNTRLLAQVTAQGRNLFRILYGLGYNMEMSFQGKVSLLPLIAFYKAWYDKYFPQRFQSWQETSAYQLIDYVFDTNRTDLDFNDSYLKGFIGDIRDCIYTYPDSYESVHQRQVNESLSAGSDSSNGDLFTGMSVMSDPVPSISDYGNIADWTLQTLTRLTKFFNKNSLIGQRVQEYISTHFGSNSTSPVFPESNYIKQINTDINLDDIVSNVDTYNEQTNEGALMGQRTGIGQGFSKNSLSYEAKDFGYLIGMCAIYPIFQYYQGVNPILLMIDRYSFPQREFDALGYELTPKALIYDNNGYINDYNTIHDGSFGYIPRYSMYKNKRNIVSGDMRLRSTAETFQGYFIDAKIQGSNLDSRSLIPNAGPEWQKVLKYPQLNYFNKIFLNAGFAYRDPYAIDMRDLDNFTIQINVSCDLYNSLKPLAMSFDTYDDDIDNDTRNISKV